MRHYRAETMISARFKRLKRQGDAIVAVALARGPWAVVEHMALVATAATAVVFGAWDDQAEILAGQNCLG